MKTYRGGLSTRAALLPHTDAARVNVSSFLDVQASGNDREEPQGDRVEDDMSI